MPPRAHNPYALQVADFVTIILTSLFVAINFKEIQYLAFKTLAVFFSRHEDSEFDIDIHIDEAWRSLLPRLTRKFVECASAALLACVISGQFFTPAPVKTKLGFLGSTKEYVDEVADIGSIFLFAFTLSVMHRWSRIVQNIQNLKQGRAPASIWELLCFVLPPGDTLLNFYKWTIIAFLSVITVAFSVSLQLVPAQTSVNFLKNNLDEVADVCSILTAALLFYYEYRLRHVVIFLNIKFQGTKFGRARAR